jgi:hypothetical protein
METIMAGAAVAEIFLASLGIAMLMATITLRGMLWVMRSAGHPQIKLRAVRGTKVALATAPVMARRSR